MNVIKKQNVRRTQDSMNMQECGEYAIIVNAREQHIMHANEAEQVFKVNEDVVHVITPDQAIKRKKYERILKNEAC